MSEAELWDQQVQWMVAGGESMMGYVSIMFAFLVMAYFVGEKLSRNQTIIACALFVWASLMQIYAAIGYFWRAQMFVDRLLEIDPALVFFLSPGVTVLIALMMLIGMVVCLLFLQQTRRK